MVSQVEQPGQVDPLLENLAEDMDGDDLRKIAEQVIDEYESDVSDRAEWDENHGLWERLYYQQDKSKRLTEWQAEESMPILAEAVNQFSARAFKAFFPNRKIITAIPIGEDSRADRDRADRVAKHMSYQLMTKDRKYKRNKRRMLQSVAQHGSFFTKTFYDPVDKRIKVENVRPQDLAVPYGNGPRDIDDIERKTHILHPTINKTKWLKHKEFFIEEAEKWEEGDQRETTEAEQESEGVKQSDFRDNDSAITRVLEQHRLLELKGDKIARPYIVWVDNSSRKVLRITRRFDGDQVIEYFTHYPFIENPDGFYGLGMGHLVGQINQSVNKILRQTMDAATLANIGNHSGFISAQVAPEGGDLQFELGEFKKLAHSADDLKRGIFTFSFPGPQPVLLEMMDLLMRRADRLSSVTEMVSGQAEKVMQPTVVLALIEQAMEQYSSIYEGLFDAWGDELNLIYQLNGRYIDYDEYFSVLDATGETENLQVLQSDYAPDMQVLPLADPKMATQQQKLTRAQAEFQTGLQSPDTMNSEPHRYQLFRRYYEALGIDEIAEILPQPQEKEPDRVDDPMLENMGAMYPIPTIPPVDMEQNHLEHLQAHESFLADPEWGPRITPEGKKLMEDHIQQHLALLYGLTEANLGEVMEGEGGQERGGALANEPGNEVVPGDNITAFPG